MTGQINIDEFLRAKRTRHNLLRKKIIEKRQRNRHASKKIYKDSGVEYIIDQSLVRKLLKYLEKVAYLSKSALSVYKKKREVVQLPRVFDLHNNPEESLRAVSRVCHHMLNPRMQLLEINHDEVEDIGYSAEALISVMAAECRRQVVNAGRRSPRLKGTYAESARVQKMMNKAGIVGAVGGKVHDRTDQSHAEYFIRRSFFHRVSQEEDPEADRKTRACSDMQKYMNSCLSSINLELSEDAEHQLGVYLGEILGNAEDHSEEKLWIASGYFDPDSKMCEIVVLNFGTTFYDTFRKLDKSHFVREQSIQPYIDAHKSSGFSENELTTIAALQSSISSKNYDERGTRGSGTIDFIEFFQDISSEINELQGEPAQMSILSGEVQLLFDKYVKITDHGQRQVVAFNAENDLHAAPERKYVKRLRSDINFPGTIISIKFPFSSKSKLVSKVE